jgi:hypothetical protein
MLTERPRDQFQKWRRSRRRILVCSFLSCPDLWLQCSVSLVYSLKQYTILVWCVFFKPCTLLCRAKNKVFINFWNLTILLCMPCTRKAIGHVATRSLRTVWSRYLVSFPLWHRTDRWLSAKQRRGMLILVSDDDPPTVWLSCLLPGLLRFDFVWAIVLQRHLHAHLRDGNILWVSGSVVYCDLGCFKISFIICRRIQELLELLTFTIIFPFDAM